eukprot:TRINITY_DN19064_c0_g1_i3.p1 TRINITY_DN19064_c0_g1~~TRINITY_DN19064_c0_g1_i3.p1  ORF type:complete len:238 (-),score=32.29 TRINITY_DN19064_c0_g1_i3:28-663(-)
MEDSWQRKVPLEFGMTRVGFGIGVGCGIGIGIGKPVNFGGIPIAGQIMSGLQQGANVLNLGALRQILQKRGGDAGLGCGVGVGYGWGLAGIYLSSDATEVIQRYLQKAREGVQNQIGHYRQNNQQIIDNNDVEKDEVSTSGKKQEINNLLEALVDGQKQQLELLQRQSQQNLELKILNDRILELEEVVCEIKPKHSFCRGREKYRSSKSLQ